MRPVRTFLGVVACTAAVAGFGGAVASAAGGPVVGTVVGVKIADSHRMDGAETVGMGAVGFVLGTSVGETAGAVVGLTSAMVGAAGVALLTGNPRRRIPIRRRRGMHL